MGSWAWGVSGLISFDEMLEQIEHATERAEQWRELAAEAERRKLLCEQLEIEKERAQAASVAKTNFLTNMSHEMRTPLASIIGLVDVLLEAGDDAQGKEEQLLLLDSIKRNGTHLLSIISEILDLAKIDAGRFEAQRVPLSPTQIVDAAVALLRHQAEEKGLALEVDCADDVPASIEGDPTLLTRVLLNLMGNAIKFTHEGRVKIELRRIATKASSALRFSVIDTGVGIAEDQLSRLFEPFEQADNSTSREYGGTGLGLAICKHLTELMGGTLEAESQLDQGSRFSLTLVVGPPDHETPPEPVASPRTPAPRITCRVLVAEDSPDNQRVVRHLLELAGAEVEVVDNGQLAVERALSARDEQQAFDLILMDMQMPVLDGYDATRLLRQRDYTGAIVALTAHAMQGERERCLEAGCDAYETKPIPRARLTDLLRRFVAGAKSDSLD